MYIYMNIYSLGSISLNDVLLCRRELLATHWCRNPVFISTSWLSQVVPGRPRSSEIVQRCHLSPMMPLGFLWQVVTGRLMVVQGCQGRCRLSQVAPGRPRSKQVFQVRLGSVQVVQGRPTSPKVAPGRPSGKSYLAWT